jgi:hypothetical protein
VKLEQLALTGRHPNTNTMVAKLGTAYLRQSHNENGDVAMKILSDAKQNAQY